MVISHNTNNRFTSNGNKIKIDEFKSWCINSIDVTGYYYYFFFDQTVTSGHILRLQSLLNMESRFSQNAQQ